MAGAGAIIAEQAYAQGKMLDHSEWNSFLPRGITPSDIDAVVANGQHVLFWELSSQHTTWANVSKGQRRLAKDLVLGSNGNHWAALVKHSVPKTRTIRTVTDVDSFAVMFLGFDGGIQCTNAIDASPNGAVWARFVREFYRNRTEAIRWAFLSQDEIRRRTLP